MILHIIFHNLYKKQTLLIFSSSIVSEEIMFCTKCGNELKDFDHFCSKCGQQVKPNLESNYTVDNTSHKKTAKEKKESGVWSVIIIISLIGIVFFGLATVGVFIDEMSSSSASPSDYDYKSLTNAPDIPSLDKDTIGVATTAYPKKYRILSQNFRRAIDYNSGEIDQEVIKITGKTSSYDLEDICYTFEYVNYYWQYQEEPGEYFFTASQTTKDYEGDCDDYSILMSALMENMGFNTRIVVANDYYLNGHAYPEIYIADDVNQLQEVRNYIGERYDISYVNYKIRETENGVQYWLSLDWSGSGNTLHPGGKLFEGNNGNSINYYPKGLIEFNYQNLNN